MRILSAPFAAVCAMLMGTALAPSVSLAVTCPTDAACNGNNYTATAANVGGNTWQLTVTVEVLDSYTGNKWTDKLSALGIKTMAPAISNASLFSAPGGGDPFDFYTGEVNNGGDVCADDNSPGTKLCAWAGDGKGVGFTAGDLLTFVFQFDAASLNENVHIKYQYIEADGNKIGSLGSFDIPIGGGDDDDDQDVPEPGTLALLGLGLLGLGLTRRRRA